MPSVVQFHPYLSKPSTDITGSDELTGRGVPTLRRALISGTTRTDRMNIGLCMADASSKHDGKCASFSLGEFPRQTVRKTPSMGHNLQLQMACGLLDA